MERYDFMLSRGGTFGVPLRFKENGVPIDLTGYSARSQVRENPDGGKLICEMETSITGAEGLVTLTIPASVSAAIPSGAYCWDLKLTDGSGVVSYDIGGRFTVFPTVTE